MSRQPKQNKTKQQQKNEIKLTTTATAKLNQMKSNHIIHYTSVRSLSPVKATYIWRRRSQRAVILCATKRFKYRAVCEQVPNQRTL